MKKVRVFQLCRKDDETWDLIAEFELTAQPDIHGLYSLKEHREVSLADGKPFSIMCELTGYGNYLFVRQARVNVLSLKVEGQFEISLVLKGGGEIHIDTIDD